jgi:hypothetical protein
MKTIDPKEKAIELVKLFYRHAKGQTFEVKLIHSKEIAIHAVDEVIDSLPSVIFVSDNGKEVEYLDKKKYWQDVKSEIESLEYVHINGIDIKL